MSGKPPKSSALQKVQRKGAQTVCCWKYSNGSQKKKGEEKLSTSRVKTNRKGKGELKGSSMKK